MSQRLPEPLFAWDHGWLEVSSGHRLYYEQWGRKDGPIALVLHGGPGSGFSERLLSFFNPEQYRIVAFDQRGCGRSIPRGSCSANTTGHLLDDIERLRRALGVTRWLVVGGSWGATLGLAYATRYRERVTGLLLRGFFWPGAAEINSFFADRPWRQWAAQLTASSMAERHAAALAWWHWELSRSGENDLPGLSPTQLDAMCDRYHVQAHYLLHGCWLNEAGLGRGALMLADLSIQFLHGSADRVCPIASARRVHEWLKGSHWYTVSGAGHDPFHPALDQAMHEALRLFGETGQFRR